MAADPNMYAYIRHAAFGSEACATTISSSAASASREDRLQLIFLDSSTDSKSHKEVAANGTYILGLHLSYARVTNRALRCSIKA